jgi:hypothetical protein
MPTRFMNLREGHNLIFVEAKEDLGFARIAQEVDQVIEIIEKDWTMEMVGGIKLDDDPSAGKNSYIGYFTAVLKKRKK